MKVPIYRLTENKIEVEYKALKVALILSVFAALLLYGLGLKHGLEFKAKKACLQLNKIRGVK